MSEWYPMYPGDFIRDTMHLSCEDIGAYIRLMNWYYSTGNPIPNDVHVIKKIIGESLQKTRKKLEILSSFFEEKDGLLFHKKIEFELAKSLKIRERRQASGKAGGKASAIAKAQANHNHNHIII
jgi:uncharacterized protein YdaU (DUF1376 family)